MQRREFLPKLALVIGAAAVACREAVTAPFKALAPTPKLLIKRDGSWVLGYDGKPLIAQGGPSDPVPAGYVAFSGVLPRQMAPSCDLYCQKGAASCDPGCWHCGFDYSHTGCISLCTCPGK